MYKVSSLINKVLCGDSLEVLAKFPSNFLDMVLFSPPYFNLRDYGVEGQIGREDHPDKYVKNIVKLCDKLKPVLKKTGTMFIVIGDTYFGRYGGGPSSYERKKGKTWKDESKCYLKRPHKHVKFNGKLLQHKQKLLIPYRVAIALQESGWILRNDLTWYKCLTGDTPIYAKSHGRIKRTTIRKLYELPHNDLYLPSPDKGWCKVTNFRKLGKRNIIVLYLKDGYKLEVTPEHRFRINRKFVQAKDIKKGDILDVASYLPFNDKGLFSEEEGWLVGLFIAEGNYEKKGNVVRFSLSSKEKEYSKRLKNICRRFGASYKEYQYGTSLVVKLYGQMMFGFVKQYVIGEGSLKKHLSRNIWNTSKEFLRGIVSGWLDGDGWYDKKNNRYRCSIGLNTKLIEDLRAICSILHYSFRSRRYFSEYQYGKKESICVEVRKNRNIHSVNRNSEVIKKVRGIRKQVYEIEVSNHLFLLPNLVISHNSNYLGKHARDRWTTKTERILFLVKSSKYYFNQDNIKHKWKESSITRLKYGSKSKKDKLAIKQGIRKRTSGEIGRSAYKRTGGLATDYDIVEFPVRTKGFSYKHFAIYPIELCKYLIKAGSPEDGIILDPMCGSGTTLEAGLQLNRKVIGIDINPDYVTMSRERIKPYLQQTKLV